MTALVKARAHDPSYDFRTTAASDAVFSVVGPGANGAAVTSGVAARRETAAANGSTS